jgi:primosomal protein N' (replication factor Y) (superfamily II helicase)
MEKMLFAEVILPFAVKGTFTYKIPDRMADVLAPGSRVLVELGKRKLYSGIVSVIHDKHEGEADGLKEILQLLDKSPVVSSVHLEFWKWVSEYYMCTQGEVMKAALPSGLCLEGEAGREIREKYQPREELFVILSKKYTDGELNDILDNLSRAPKQENILSAYLRLTGYSPGSDLFPVKKSLLLKEADALQPSLDILIRKGILVLLNLGVSRIKRVEEEKVLLCGLTENQLKAFSSVKSGLEEKEIILLHGVTSSGKTEVYIHLIEEQLKKGKQVLYLLPEIALTTQIISRLRRHFGNITGIYHSRISDAEQVEIWNRVGNTSTKDSFMLMLGARSALFLPFSNLGLIIVDEEHDSSYKQSDPAPRYNARDSAIMLASFTGAGIVLGSATPSLESYNNALTGKYRLVEIAERFGKINMPEIILANTRDAARKKLMVSHFTPRLLHAIDNALHRGEQVILFRNRRGFSSFIECSECGWIPSCTKCSVKMTYHRESNKLVCHYCGSSSSVPVKCGSCGSISLATVGFGTEKIEDEIKIVFPGARVDRIDQDSTKRRSSFRNIITRFENRQTDILIGTQMISKGLDFENITVVGILNADSLLNFPDFRSHERAFQLMLQVSGRAGRRQKQGKVIIQTSDPENRVILQVLNNDFNGMYQSQMEERRLFNYPPFCRMIKITLRHKERSMLNEFSAILGSDLKSSFGKRVLGPEFPVIPRIQNYYIKNIIIKIEREKPLVRAKQIIREAVAKVERMKGSGSLRIVIDVDPY